MSIGMVGRKLGMTRVFTETGESLPVTAILAEPNRVCQVKTKEIDGYSAIQVTFGERKPSRVNKPMAGHFSKAKVMAGRGLREFRVEASDIEAIQEGAEIGVEQFEAGQFVDVTGISKGKGFAGTIKRHNFRGQDRSHGNSLSHRVPGSIGQNQTPGRVFKGKKMAGHMGNSRVTMQNLQVVRVDADRHLILVKGAVPGAVGQNVIIRPAVKKG